MHAHDTCGTCAGRHRTASCTPGVLLRCISCKISSHASWSQHCPTFNQKCKELNGRLTENMMPYFPTSEPWTHVIQPPKPGAQLPPAPHNFEHHLGASRGPYRQSTLQFLPSQWHPQGGTQPSTMPDRANDVPRPGVNRDNQGRPWPWGDSDGLDHEDLPPLSFP